MQELTSMSYSLQKQRKNSEKKDRLKGLKCQLNVTGCLH